MATAIEALDTYPAATKLSPTNKLLTPTDTSYNVPVGVHDGTESVYIQLDPLVTITPSASQQVITPSDSNHFLGDVKVNGVSSSGYKIATGTITQLSASSVLEISGFNFKPIHLLLINMNGGSGSYPMCTSQTIQSPTTSYGSGGYWAFGRFAIHNMSSCQMDYGYVRCDSGNSSYPYVGTFRWFVWGN